MILLALDTSSSAVTVAVHDGSSVVAERTEFGAQAHGELLAPTIAAVLSDASVGVDQLTVIVAGVGPGPFTGLRVGLVTARVMSEALAIPAHGVCSLDALAAQAVAEGTVSTPFAVATDARRKEVYLATYDEGGSRLTGPEVALPSAVAELTANGPVVGEGAALYASTFADPRGPRLVSAAWLAVYAVAQMSSGAELGDTAPMYLRRPDAVESAGRKRVTQP